MHGSSLSDGESNKEAVLIEGDNSVNKMATVNVLIGVSATGGKPASMKISKN